MLINLNKLYSFLILFVLFSYAENGNAQNCTIHPYVQENYLVEAKYLAFQEMLNSNHPLHNSILIPDTLVNKHLLNLSLVYNLQNTSSDSIFNILYITNTVQGISFSAVEFDLDTNIQWFQNLNSDTVYQVGVDSLDSLLANYNLKFVRTNPEAFGLSWSLYNVFHLETDSIINTQALANKLNLITGFSNAAPVFNPFPLGGTLNSIKFNNDTLVFAHWLYQIFDFEWKYLLQDCNVNLISVKTPRISSLEQKSSELLIYPNPSNDIVYLKFSNALVDKIKVVNVLGEIINETVINTDETILDVSNFASGIYFIHSHIDGQPFINKFIVSK